MIVNRSRLRRLLSVCRFSDRISTSRAVIFVHLSRSRPDAFVQPQDLPVAADHGVTPVCLTLHSYRLGGHLAIAELAA